MIDPRTYPVGHAARAFALLALLIVASWASGARAEDPRVEAAARDALTHAEDDYLVMAFDKGLLRLARAARACGGDRCTANTRALLLRDLGTFQLRAGDAAGASASFAEALRLAPGIELNPSYDARDLRGPWDAAKDAITQAAPPSSGDFVHTPFREQAATTPVPVYVELVAGPMPASVVVKYKTQGMRTFKRAVLSRLGAGFGGYISCADVTLGRLVYYVQGFDARGLPVANTGDPKHTFSVAIREHITSEAPTLPGQAAPRACGDEETEALRLEDGDRCHEDNQCKSAACTNGHCARTPTSSEIVTERYARVWIGASASADLTIAPAGADVCIHGATVGTSYWCTNPDGSDYPTAAQSAALVRGRGGNPPGGVTGGTVHLLATADYAATSSLLMGVRFGYVAQSYSGQAAIAAGRGLPLSLHAELRATYVFGREPLLRGGLAPYAAFAGGVSRFDANVTAQVSESGVVGAKPVQAWVVAGPWFAAVGGGIRYAFSPVIAFWAGAKLTAALGPGGVIGVASPEIGLQRGF